MKIRSKIILPIFLLLVIILCSFGFFLYDLRKQENFISAQILNLQKLNNLNERLAKQQHQTDYNVLSYRFNPDKSLLLAIAQAEINKSKTLDEMYPLVTTQRGRELTAAYINAQKEVESLRNKLIHAINEGNQTQINLHYDKWSIHTQNAQAAFDDLHIYNINSLEKIIIVISNTRAKIIQVIITLTFIIITTVILLYFYLKTIITTPIIKLAAAANKLAKIDFTRSSNRTNNNINFGNDEIGVLTRSFNTMNIKLKTYYENLEKKVKERTRQLEKEKMIVESSKNAQIRHEVELETKERDFISMASHQLLTPLTLMKGYISMLISGKIGKINYEAKKCLEESLLGGDRMSRLIKSLLTTSKIENSCIKFKKTDFDFCELVQSVVLELKPKINDKRLDIKISTPDNLMVFADKNQTREILINVIGNAVKYTPKGEILITGSQANSMATIAVKDSGVGINEKDLPHIFEKFYSSENWLQKQSDSHGLGLYIAELLLKLMNGNITAESKINEGSTFFVSLPLSKNVKNIIN